MSLDITGKLIVTQTMAIHAQFDVSKFANGVYTIQVKNKAGEVIQSSKIVKN